MSVHIHIHNQHESVISPSRWNIDMTTNNKMCVFLFLRFSIRRFIYVEWNTYITRVLKAFSSPITGHLLVT